ncbi:hypothetical protein C0992_010397, partial [Termitomyces sp. T32_za158]
TYVEKLVVRDIEMSGVPDFRWMITNGRFHATLCLLGPRLKRFTFIADNYTWNTFPASFKLAFVSIFTSPSLTCIRLQGLEAIPRACCVYFGSQVVDLTIVTSSFSNEVDADLPKTEDSLIPPNLYWLHLEDVHERSIRILLDVWIPATSQGQPLFPCLTALSVGPPDQDVLGPIWELIQAGRKTIQYFHWDYPYGSQGALIIDTTLELCFEFRAARPLNTPPLNLSILEKLFAIRYEVTFYPDDEIEAMPDPPDHFDGLSSLLRTAKPSTIQQIDVKVDFRDFGDAMESLQEHDGWSVLDCVLASESFDQIYQFTVQLDLETFMSEDDIDVGTDLMARKAEMKALLEARLPSLLTMNSYRFIFTVERQRI